MSNEIRLYGPIGGYFGITAEEILEQIPEGAKEITLRIHSPGGSVGEGLAMYNALRDNPARVLVVVDGYAASSASFVMLAGDEVRVHKSSMVFVHNPWTVAEGNANELRKVADDLDKHGQAILNIYKERTGMDEESIRQMMDDSIFMVGAEALDNGFADSVIDDAEANNAIAAMLDFDKLAAQLKGEKMSTQKTRKEVAAERDALAAENKEHLEELDTLKGVRDDLMAAQAEMASMKTAIDTMTAEAQERAEAVSKLTAELESVKQSIHRPETVDAAIVATSIEVPVGDVEDEKTDEDDKEPVNHLEVYQSLSDPRVKMAYWQEHENEIINDSKEK